MSRRNIPAKWIRDMLPKKCMNCGSTTGIVYHHIVPVIYGGNEVPTNIAVLCNICHGKVHYGKCSEIDHGEAVKRGQEAAKARGVKLGRRKKIDTENVLRVIAENSTQFNESSLLTESEIMEMVELKLTQYSKYKRMLLDAMNAKEWPYEWSKPVQVRNRPLYDHFIKGLRGDAV